MPLCTPRVFNMATGDQQSAIYNFESAQAGLPSGLTMHWVELCEKLAVQPATGKACACPEFSTLELL